MPLPTSENPHIGLLNEKSLHAALKRWYAQPQDRLEVPVDGFVIDIVRDDRLIEIQTGSFAALKVKLPHLVTRHPVHLVYPIARERWLVKTGKKRRKSPKKGRVEEIFRELVFIPHLLGEPNFSLEVLLIQEEVVQRYDPHRRYRRRRGWVTEERHLLAVLEAHHFQTPPEMKQLLPPTLPSPFTTQDLAQAAAMPRWLAQKMAYCLREMGEITPTGKQGRSILYT